MHAMSIAKYVPIPLSGNSKLVFIHDKVVMRKLVLFLQEINSSDLAGERRNLRPTHGQLISN